MKLKKENTIKKMRMLIVMLAIFIAVGWLSIIPNNANATGDYQPVVITESSVGNNNIYFTLITETPLITEFMIGNNDAYGAYISSINPALSGWNGYMIERDTNVSPWYVMDQSDNYNSGWINNYDPSLFDGYTKAFLWSAFDVVGDGDINGSPLDIGIYSTFIGQTASGASPFLYHTGGIPVSSTDPGVDAAFEGYTTNSIPEPLSIILLGFGLVGLAGIRRKFKG